MAELPWQPALWSASALPVLSGVDADPGGGRESVFAKVGGWASALTAMHICMPSQPWLNCLCSLQPGVQPPVYHTCGGCRPRRWVSTLGKAGGWVVCSSGKACHDSQQNCFSGDDFMVGVHSRWQHALASQSLTAPASSRCAYHQLRSDYQLASLVRSASCVGAWGCFAKAVHSRGCVMLGLTGDTKPPENRGALTGGCAPSPVCTMRVLVGIVCGWVDDGRLWG